MICIDYNDDLCIMTKHKADNLYGFGRLFREGISSADAATPVGPIQGREAGLCTYVHNRRRRVGPPPDADGGPWPRQLTACASVGLVAHRSM